MSMPKRWVLIETSEEQGQRSRKQSPPKSVPTFEPSNHNCYVFPDLTKHEREVLKNHLFFHKSRNIGVISGLMLYPTMGEAKSTIPRYWNRIATCNRSEGMQLHHITPSDIYQEGGKFYIVDTVNRCLGFKVALSP